MSDHRLRTSRMPSASPPSDAVVERPRGPWHAAGLLLLAVWATLFAIAVVLWVRVALLPDGSDGPNGTLALFGAPFVLVALGLIWSAWWSARALRRGRREGWTLLLVLGGIAVMQVVLTARPLLTAQQTGGAEGAGPPPGAAAGLLVAIGLGIVSVAVALLGRRSLASAAEPDDDVTEPG